MSDELAGLRVRDIAARMIRDLSMWLKPFGDNQSNDVLSLMFRSLPQGRAWNAGSYGPGCCPTGHSATTRCLSCIEPGSVKVNGTQSAPWDDVEPHVKRHRLPRTKNADAERRPFLLREGKGAIGVAHGFGDEDLALLGRIQLKIAGIR